MTPPDASLSLTSGKITRRVGQCKRVVNPVHRLGRCIVADEYFANGHNGAAAYRTVYRSRSSNQHCAVEASKLLANPKIARIVASHDQRVALAQENVIGEMAITEERVVQTIAALAFYDPREVLAWDDESHFTCRASADIPFRAILPIREITVLPHGGFRVKFYDRRAALMDLARLRGMISDSSKTLHVHEDLARMTPEQQRQRVAELLSFAASLKVPPTIDMEAADDDNEE
jgi:hypothetical protein